MEKIFTRIAAIALLLGVLTSCGSSNDSAMTESFDSYTSSNSAIIQPESSENFGITNSAAKDLFDTTSTNNMFFEDIETSNASTDVNNLANEDLKIIKTGSITVQTEDFDKTNEDLKQIVNELNGTIARVDISGKTGYRNAEYSLYIPSARFDEFFQRAEADFSITRQTISSEDVSDQYTDLQTKLEAEKRKYERLLELLDMAETLEDVYSIQSELTDTEYEINSLIGTMNGIDSKVAYSTINFFINETNSEVVIPKDRSFGTKLMAAFSNGFSNFVEAVESILVDLAYNFFGILIFAIVLVIGIGAGKRYKAKHPKDKQKRHSKGFKRHTAEERLPITGKFASTEDTEENPPEAKLDEHVGKE